MPDVTGTIDSGQPTYAKGILGVSSVTSGCFTSIKMQKYGFDNSTAQDNYAVSITFSASASNSTYGNSETVTPTSTSTRFFIKY